MCIKSFYNFTCHIGVGEIHVADREVRRFGGTVYSWCVYVCIGVFIFVGLCCASDCKEWKSI